VTILCNKQLLSHQTTVDIHCFTLSKITDYDRLATRPETEKRRQPKIQEDFIQVKRVEEITAQRKRCA